MKKKNFNKKLEFKKELITNLNDIKGGYNYAVTDGCGSIGPEDPPETTKISTTTYPSTTWTRTI